MDKYTAVLSTSFLLILLIGFISSSDAVWIPPCHKVVRRNARIEKLSTFNKRDKVNDDLENNAEVIEHNTKANIRKNRETQVNDILENSESLQKLEQESLKSGGLLILPSKGCDNPWTTLYIPQLNSLLTNDVVDLTSSHQNNILPISASKQQNPYNNNANVPRTIKLYFQDEPQPIVYQQSVPVPRPDLLQTSLSEGQINMLTNSLTQQHTVENPVIRQHQLSQPSYSTYSQELSPLGVKATAFSYSPNPICRDPNFCQNPIPVPKQNVSYLGISSTKQRNFPETFIHTNLNCPHYTRFPPRHQHIYQFVQSSQ